MYSMAGSCQSSEGIDPVNWLLDMPLQYEFRSRCRHIRDGVQKVIQCSEGSKVPHLWWDRRRKGIVLQIPICKRDSLRGNEKSDFYQVLKPRPNNRSKSPFRYRVVSWVENDEVWETMKMDAQGYKVGERENRSRKCARKWVAGERPIT